MCVRNCLRSRSKGGLKSYKAERGFDGEGPRFFREVFFPPIIP